MALSKRLAKWKEIPHLKAVLLLLGMTIVLDQVSKWIAQGVLTRTHALSYLGGSVRLQYAENPGAFLSLGAALTESQRFWVFTIGVTGLLGVAVYYLFFRRLSRNHAIALSLMAGGGFSNLIDRISRGSVIDFMNLGIGSLRTGIFNIADMAIIVGVVFFCLPTEVPARAPKK